MIVLAVIAAMFADLLTFWCAATIYGIAGEGNPVARVAYAWAGLPGVVGLKLLGTALALLILSGIAEPLRSYGTVVIVAMTLLAAGTNAYAVVLSR